tara:strand:+ start:605 stop:964 length:360 start_codon:yes stop_codon:yes gene_type:complete
MSENGSITINQPSGLGSFTIGDLGVFIGTLGGVITSILIVLQKSHCIRIKFCCWECDRDVKEIELEDKPTPKPKPKPKAPTLLPLPSVPEPEPEPEPEPAGDEEQGLLNLKPPKENITA